MLWGQRTARYVSIITTRYGSLITTHYRSPITTRYGFLITARYGSPITARYEFIITVRYGNVIFYNSGLLWSHNNITLPAKAPHMWSIEAVRRSDVTPRVLIAFVNSLPSPELRGVLQSK